MLQCAGGGGGGQPAGDRSDVTQAPNDKQQLEPMLDKIAALPDELGKAEACWRTTAISARQCAACARRGSTR